MTTQTYSRTRTQIMASVLANLSAGRVVTAQGNGSTTTFKITQANAAANDWVGARLLFLTGANTSGYAEVTASSTPSSGVVTLTFSPAATSTTTNDTAFLTQYQGQSFPIETLREFLNTAVQMAAGVFYHPVESLAFHTDGKTLRFDIPSTMTMLRRVQYRESVDAVTIHDATTAWDEAAAPTFVTRSVDTKDTKLAAGCNKFVIAGDFTTGVISSKAITSLNLAKYTHVEFWIKSTTATVAGDFTLLLDDTALVASALETLSIPALVADTWTFVRIALANPETDTAIISVGLNAANNIAANTVWISDVKAVVNDSGEWRTLDRQSWRIDKEARDLVLSRAPSYALLKLVGGDRPALFTADTDTTEMPESYLIAQTTALMLMAGIGGPPSLDQQGRMALANYWGKLAAAEMNALASPESGVDVP